MSDEYRCPPYFSYKLTGLAIREYLQYVGEGYPYEFYVCFKKVKPTTSYASVRRYFYILKKLGLIEPVRTEPSSKGGFPRTYYRIVIYDDPRWFAPQEALYPETRLGKKRYEKYKMAKVVEEQPYAPQVEEIRHYIDFNKIPSDLLPYIYRILDELARKGDASDTIAKMAEHMYETGTLYEAPTIFEVLEIIDSIMGKNYAEMFRELLSFASLKQLREHMHEILEKYMGW